MKLVVISDTHDMHSKISVPDGDTLIHCGDWTNRGDPFAIEKFLDWFSSQPHKKKMFIAGNHELSLDGLRSKAVLSFIKEYTDKDSNLHFLHNSSVVIDGLNFYGSPATPFFCNWAFNFHRGKDIAAEWKKIPDNVNVLITHGPSYGILDLVKDNISNKGRDLHQGCEELAKRIKELKELKLHCCGHLHTDGGKYQKVNGITYVNAAICTENYQPTNLPVEIEI
jgi:predicted phosphodiesterase